MSKTRLATIVFVEIADFPGLLESEERRALALLSAFRSLAESLVREHEGEIVDATGEELLLVFESAVSAVQFALHLFLAAEAGGKAPGGPGALVLRCGIHLGEIWRNEGRVFGNGINVAARIKQAAPPGTLLLSEDVERQVSNKLDLELRELPGQALKNIERPLRIYELAAVSRGPVAGEEAAVAYDLPAASLSDAPPIREADAVVAPPQAPPEKPDLPPRETGSPLTAKESLKRLILESVDVKVKEGGRGLTLSIEPSKRAGREVKGGTKAAASSHRPSAEEAVKSLAKGARKLLLASAVGGALGYAYISIGGWYFAAGAFLLGFLPAISGLKRILTARLELREARRSGAARSHGRQSGGRLDRP